MMLFNTSYYIFSGDNRLDRSDMQQLLGKLHVREEILKLLMFYFLVACSLTCSFIEIQHFRIIILCINSKIVSMCVLP